jgi:carbonic anhydrase
MDALKRLFDNNQAWAKRMTRDQPDFFDKLLSIQKPEYLWIGCSDSRVPANEIVELMPGELFVHRNVANVVCHTDFNCLAVLQYAVEVLKVKHVIVCGHYGCGGVMAAQRDLRMGLIDNWLRHIQDVHEKYRSLLDPISDINVKLDRLCELNVIEQAVNVCQTTLVRAAWDQGQQLTVHGWIYRLSDGLLHDLGLCVEGPACLDEYFRRTTVASKWPVGIPS